MKKKSFVKPFIGAGSALLALALVLLAGKMLSSSTILMVFGGDSEVIHHYAEVAPTSAKSGCREYWISCGSSHAMSFTKPATGTISDATHPDGFVSALPSDDSRYIAPYTFPEVFATKYAYDTSVTIESGVVSFAGAISIKSSVLSEAYGLGYTHFRCHSDATSDSAIGSIMGQDSTLWSRYNKTYKDNQDNRFWLKSFSTSGSGLYFHVIDNTSGHSNLPSYSLSLSDFHLYKSSATESWNLGTITSYSTNDASHAYIAYEDGELVFDNVGAGSYTTAGEIPSSVLGTLFSGDYRALDVKVLARDGNTPNPQGDSLDRLVMVNGTDGSAFPYFFDSDNASSDGFLPVKFNNIAGHVGLLDGRYSTSALSIGFEGPAAFAIRLNSDYSCNWIGGMASWVYHPQLDSSNGTHNLQMVIAGTGDSGQLNATVPGGAGSKSIAGSLVSSAQLAGITIMNFACGANIAFPAGVPNGDGTYTYDISCSAADSGGYAFIIKYTATASCTITINYSFSGTYGA